MASAWTFTVAMPDTRRRSLSSHCSAGHQKAKRRTEPGEGILAFGSVVSVALKDTGKTEKRVLRVLVYLAVGSSVASV